MALGIGDLSLWFEDIRKKGGFADTDALFNLGASQNPEFRNLPSYSDYGIRQALDWGFQVCFSK